MVATATRDDPATLLTRLSIILTHYEPIAARPDIAAFFTRAAPRPSDPGVGGVWESPCSPPPGRVATGECATVTDGRRLSVDARSASPATSVASAVPSWGCMRTACATVGLSRDQHAPGGCPGERPPAADVQGDEAAEVRTRDTPTTAALTVPLSLCRRRVCRRSAIRTGQRMGRLSTRSVALRGGVCPPPPFRPSTCLIETGGCGSMLAETKHT